ncbi:unnamed protein product [Schistosoma curassoni]|uniref:Uncharacterized protein n=1 Tax=Schistosoma curassoni TaxID=6186 RepID=A0A183KY40_9TREM|nr:unnamed protein product [Schistosoma curassoni]
MSSGSSIAHATTNAEENDQCSSSFSSSCLNIRKQKIKILRYNTACANRFTFDGDLGDVKTFTYLCSIIDEHDGSDADVEVRIGKARAAYRQVKNIRNSKNVYQSTSNSKFSIQMSKQFYCIG